MYLLIRRGLLITCLHGSVLCSRHQGNLYVREPDGAGKACIVGRPGERGHLILMPAERQQRFPARCVPDLYRCICGARGNALAVRRPHDCIHRGRVPAIGQDGFPRRRLPDLRGLVRRAGDDRAAIGRPADLKSANIEQQGELPY